MDWLSPIFSLVNKLISTKQMQKTELLQVIAKWAYENRDINYLL